MEKVQSPLSNLKAKVNTLDLDNLVPILAGWCKLSDIEKNDVVKKTECDHIR